MPAGEAAATAVAKELIEATGSKILDPISKKVSREIAKLRVHYTDTFQEHLASSLFRATYVKTVVSKDRAVRLRDIYVTLFLSQEDNGQFSDDQLDPTLNVGCRYIISGTGGAGKTILMKHLLLRCSEKADGKIPLFIELRNLEFAKKRKFPEIILAGICEDCDEESIELFLAGLEEGLFTLFFDGFDEINPEFTDQATKMIAAFSRKYKKCSVVMSTRPGTGIHSLVNFDVFHVLPLSKDQAIELIDKTKFDEVSKAKFRTALQQDLYDKHQTMMSIPILIVMMLLTFRSYGEIPDRMTVFYSQAFDTLYSIHDAEGKESYKRVHDSGLPPDLFRRVLNAFCYSSLCKYEIEFDRDSLNFYVEKGIKIAQAPCKTADYISDLIKNVCILQPDGTSYIFVHRSFQEFFAASFLSRYSGKQLFKAYDQLISVCGPDIIRMLAEIDRAKFERQWVLPKLEKFAEDLLRFKDKGAVEQASALAKRLIVRGESPHLMPGLSRSSLSSDGMMLAYATTDEIHPTKVIRQIEFGKTATQRIEAMRPRSAQSAAGRALQERRGRTIAQLTMTEENKLIMEDSNFSELFARYIDYVESVRTEVRQRVENDVVIEDIIFE
ncbi:NACHT domain-containing protein [Altererythrobacter lutimaris]|uniref:NACHT domain-containing protein n=1 Tax=Altererythrobacter lutimaris TaxID=2743979 RepID=A0A850HAV6_9SPHN|nr:NACHT domain-containing protein [Altererythrobacter lutimaris]NVE94111.1 NACHT domain-containing protein [Altererythrobacter lutimaris]